MNQKVNFLEKDFFPSFCAYMLCPRSGEMVLLIFPRFLSFGPFFEPFLGTVLEITKHKRVAPGNSLNFQKQ